MKKLGLCGQEIAAILVIIVIVLAVSLSVLNKAKVFKPKNKPVVEQKVNPYNQMGEQMRGLRQRESDFK